MKTKRTDSHMRLPQPALSYTDVATLSARQVLVVHVSS